jgi:hypothetical protein
VVASTEDNNEFEVIDVIEIQSTDVPKNQTTNSSALPGQALIQKQNMTPKTAETEEDKP